MFVFLSRSDSRMIEAEPSEPSAYNTVSSSKLSLSGVEKRLAIVNATPASSELPSYDSLNRQQGITFWRIHRMDTNSRCFIMLCNYQLRHISVQVCTYVFIDLKMQLVDIKWSLLRCLALGARCNQGLNVSAWQMRIPRRRISTSHVSVHLREPDPKLIWASRFWSIQNLEGDKTEESTRYLRVSFVTDIRNKC